MRYGKKILYLFVCVKYRNPIYEKMALLTHLGELSIPFFKGWIMEEGLDLATGNIAGRWLSHSILTAT